MTVRYEARRVGVYDTELKRVITPTDPQWGLEYIPWIAAGNAPASQAAPSAPITDRRAEAKRRVLQRLAQALLEPSAKITVGQITMRADMPSVIFYLLMKARTSIPAGDTIPDADGNPVLITGARLQLLIDALAARWDKALDRAVTLLAEIDASPNPESINEDSLPWDGTLPPSPRVPPSL